MSAICNFSAFPTRPDIFQNTVQRYGLVCINTRNLQSRAPDGITHPDLIFSTISLNQNTTEQRRLLDEESRREAARERAAEERAQQLGNWFGGIAFLLGFPSIVLSFLQVIGVSDWREAGLWLAGAVTAGAVLMLIVHLRLKARMTRASAATGSAGNNPTMERRANTD